MSRLTWRRACGAAMLVLGVIFLALGTWQQSVSLSILGIAFWIAALLGLGVLLLLRVNAVKILTEAHSPQGAVHQNAPRSGAPIYAGMASIPTRVKALEQAVASVYDQVDRLFVYLNNYDEVPPFLKREKISVLTSQRYGDIKDSGKFFGLTRVKRGIYLSLDDDLRYPPDYVRRMASTVVRFKNKCVVGVHGIFLPTLAHSFFDRSVIHYEKKWEVTAPVSILGTGTVAFSIEDTGISFDIFKHHGMADIALALFMKERRIPPLVIRREAGWLSSLLPDDDSTLYRGAQRDSTRQTGAIVAARPWGLSELYERVKHAGILELMPDRWHAVMTAYRKKDGAAEALAKYPLAMLIGLIRTHLNTCEAWEFARRSQPSGPKDVQLHCNLLRSCLVLYPEQVLDLCRERCSHYKDRQEPDAMMAYGSVCMAALCKLSMYEEGDALYRNLAAKRQPSPDVDMEYLRLKSQEGDHERVVSLARERYVELSRYGDFVRIAYGAVAHVDGLEAALHGFMPSFFTDGRQADRNRRAIIATCRQARTSRLGGMFEFDFAAAEAGAIQRQSVRCFLDLILFYAVLGEKKRARSLLERNKARMDEWYGSSMRTLLYAMTAEDQHDVLIFINEYNRLHDLVPLTISTPANGGNFLSSLGSATATSGLEDKGKVSIIIGAFNAAGTVGYSVRSVLAQSYRNIEVIVVDDGSTDGTWEELEKLRHSDSRVRTIRNAANSGPYICRNIALEATEGTYVAIHDADDFAHPQRLERQMTCFDRPDVVAVFAAHIRFNSRGQIALENNGAIVGDGPMTFLCRRSVFSDIGEFERVRTRGDIEFWDRMKCYYGSHRVLHLDEVLVYALHDSESNSHAMVRSPEARRRLELFRAAYNRRLMLVRSTAELKRGEGKVLTRPEPRPAVPARA